MTTLDYIDKIKVDEDVFAEPCNEYWALTFLWEGMEFLYRHTQHYDHVVKKRVDPECKRDVFICGNHPALQGVPIRLLTSAFHWYAISACQYVTTVGNIAYKADSNRQLPNKYRDSVIPGLVIFRNKIAAHFAWSTQNKRDNDAERIASIIPQISFKNNSFYIGNWAARVRRSCRESDSMTIKPWSLSKVHESLRERYCSVDDRENDS